MRFSSPCALGTAIQWIPVIAAMIVAKLNQASRHHARRGEDQVLRPQPGSARLSVGAADGARGSLASFEVRKYWGGIVGLTLQALRSRKAGRSATRATTSSGMHRQPAQPQFRGGQIGGQTHTLRRVQTPRIKTKS